MLKLWLNSSFTSLHRLFHNNQLCFNAIVNTSIYQQSLWIEWLCCKMLQLHHAINVTLNDTQRKLCCSLSKYRKYRNINLFKKFLVDKFINNLGEVSMLNSWIDVEWKIIWTWIIFFILKSGKYWFAKIKINFNYSQITSEINVLKFRIVLMMVMENFRK